MCERERERQKDRMRDKRTRDKSQRGIQRHTETEIKGHRRRSCWTIRGLRRLNSQRRTGTLAKGLGQKKRYVNEFWAARLV